MASSSKNSVANASHQRLSLSCKETDHLFHRQEQKISLRGKEKGTRQKNPVPAGLGLSIRAWVRGCPPRGVSRRVVTLQINYLKRGPNSNARTEGMQNEWKLIPEDIFGEI